MNRFKIRLFLSLGLILSLILLSIPLPVRAETDWQALLERYVEEREERTASVSMAFFDREQLLGEVRYGLLNEEAGIRASDEGAVYEWGSVSKMLVWVAVMQVAEEGKLDLEADLSTMVPDEVLHKRCFPEKLSMLNLMNHNAGFIEMTFNSETEDAAEIRGLKDSLIRFAPTQAHRPGEVTAYSNWGAALAGWIVEEISGKPFAEVVRERIFEPLGMERTSVLPDFSDQPLVREQRQQMRGYAYGLDYHEELGSSIYYIPLYPAGAVCGSFDDFLRFARALLPEGKSPLFKKQETLEQLFSASLYYTGTEIPRVCHGLWTLPYGNGLVGHAGNTGGFSSAIFFDPVAGKGYAVMTNEAGEIEYNYGILERLFGEWKADFSVTEDVGERPDLGGVFLSSRHSFGHGIAKLTAYVASFLIHRETEEKGRYKLALAEDLEMRQVDSSLYILEMGPGVKTLKNLRAGEGGAVLEGYTNDERQVSSLHYFSRLGLFILFLLAFVIALIRLGLIPFVALFRKIRSSKRELPALKAEKECPQRLASLSVILMGVLVYMLVFSDQIYRMEIRQLQSGLTLLLLLFQIGLLIYGILKKPKHFLWMIFLLSVSVINCLYWEWFYFCFA